MNINNILIPKKSIYILIITTFVILLLPLIAMQFTNEVNWGFVDFVIAGVLISSFGYLYQVLIKASNNNLKNAFIGLIVLVLFVFVWLNLI